MHGCCYVGGQVGQSERGGVWWELLSWGWDAVILDCQTLSELPARVSLPLEAALLVAERGSAGCTSSWSYISPWVVVFAGPGEDDRG